MTIENLQRKVGRLELQLKSSEGEQERRGGADGRRAGTSGTTNVSSTLLRCYSVQYTSK